MRKGNVSLRRCLSQAAWAISMMKNNYLSALYRRIAARRGAKRAVMAVAHALLEIAYHMLKRKEDYRELGADHFDRIDVNRIRRSLVRRLERLGHKVTLEPLAQTARRYFRRSREIRGALGTLDPVLSGTMRRVCGTFDPDAQSREGL
jgi:transposase